MTIHHIAPDFPLSTPPVERPGREPLRLSVRPLDAIPAAEIARELANEVAQRRDAYPRLVARGRLTEPRATRHQQILERIAEGFANEPWGTRRDALRAVATVSPLDAIGELRRELAIRRAAWPRAIAAGQLPEADARPRMEAIEAAHFALVFRTWHWDWFDMEWPAATAACRDIARGYHDAADAELLRLHRAADPAVAGAVRVDWIPDFEAATRRHAARVAQLEQAA